MSDTVHKLAVELALQHSIRIKNAVDTYPPGAIKLVQCPACDKDLWRMWRPADDGEPPRCDYWRRAVALGLVGTLT